MKKATRILRKTLSVFLYILTALLLVLAVFLAYSKLSGKVPFVFGYGLFQVVSPSMEDTIPTGAYILVRETPPETVQEGDVISFYSSDPAIFRQINTHRVLRIEGEGEERRFVTKGDNNSVEDAYTVKPGDVVGVYQYNVPFLSGIGGFIRNPIVFFFIAMVPALILFVSELLNVKRKAQEARMEALVEQEKKRIAEESADSPQQEGKE